MAARNRSRERPLPEPDIREVVALQVVAARHRDELLDEARELQAVGRIDEARERAVQAERAHQRLTAVGTDPAWPVAAADAEA